MAKLTLEEKRLEKIRMQLFGKEQNTSAKKASVFVKKNSDTNQSAPLKTHVSSTHFVESGFMKKDLMKVAVLSLIAIGGQFLLYYLSLQGIINLTVLHIF